MVAAVQSDESLDEEVRLGQEAYDRYVKPRLRSEDDGKLVAIDIDSGQYEIDADDYRALDRLTERLPDARICLLRVGRPATYRIGLLNPIGAA